MTRERLPFPERTGLTHKATIISIDEDGQQTPVRFYITANTYPDGRLAEVFLTADKEGSTIAGLLDCVATLTSIALQSGVLLRTLVEKFGYSRFAPAGPTKGESPIKNAKSIVDYVFRWLGLTFLSEEEKEALHLIEHHPMPPPEILEPLEPDADALQEIQLTITPDDGVKTRPHYLGG